MNQYLTTESIRCYRKQAQWLQSNWSTFDKNNHADIHTQVEYYDGCYSCRFQNFDYMDYLGGGIEDPVFWIVLGFSYEGMDVGHTYTLGKQQGVVTHNNFQICNHLVGFDIQIDLPQIGIPPILHGYFGSANDNEVDCPKVTLVYIPVTGLSATSIHTIYDNIPIELLRKTIFVIEKHRLYKKFRQTMQWSLAHREDLLLDVRRIISSFIHHY